MPGWPRRVGCGWSWSRAGCQRRGHDSDRVADRLGDRVSDREEGADSLLPHISDVGEEGFRRSGADGADQDVGAVPVGAGDLRKCGDRHRDVIGGGVGSGIAGPQSPGHRLDFVDLGTAFVDRFRRRLVITQLADVDDKRQHGGVWPSKVGVRPWGPPCSPSR